MNPPDSMPTSARGLDNAPNMAVQGYLLYTVEDGRFGRQQINTYYQHPDRWQYILEQLERAYADHQLIQEIWLENEIDEADQVCLWRRK